MLTINHAILHAFDFDTGSCYLSEHELDMDEKLVKSYVRRHLRRCAASDQNMHGEFAQDSGFAEELGLYLDHRTSFIDLSKQIAEFFWDTLRKCDDLVQADLLVADFEQSPDAPKGDASDEELEKSFSGEAQRRFAVILLPRSQTFMHSIEHPSGGAFNEIVRHDATLPNPSGRVNTYVLVDCDTMAIDYCDKLRTVAEAEVWIMQNLLLKCTREPSSREVMQTVEALVEEVAEVGNVNVVEAVGHAKACMAHAANLEERLIPEQIGREVFEDDPRLTERFEERAREVELPEEVQVRAAAARRLAKNHRIRTDTGVDVTYPSDFSTNPDYLSFQYEEDGTMTILIRNVRSIENR
ncbi:MAG: nucleoid-associated protein [Coriobacteriales bacterium]|nr:nucleoid-associated protein [Coriobacteriales bacterium]